MPETRGSVMQNKQREHSSSLKNELRTITQESGLAAKLLTTEPTVFIFMLWCAFSFGLIFISTESIAQVFTTTFKFEDYQTGLIQCSMFVGEIFGVFFCLLINQYYARSARSKGTESDKPIVERSLHFSIPATIIGLAGGLLIYAWTSYSQLPWIAPSIGLALQGCATQIIVNAVTIYITDSYERYAASAVAGIAFGENTFAAFLPLASLPMYSKLGFQWASSLLGFVALILTAAPIVLTWKGPQIRARSKAISAMSWD